jgi:hypothetical protein
MTSQPKLDWSNAEVVDGQLTVALTEKPPKEWRGVFERTATRLSAGKWDVTLHAKKATVQVSSLQPGDEERVRQFIEGAVLEANSQTGAGDKPTERDDAATEDDADATSEPSADERLTDSFRGYASSDSEADADEPADSDEG